MVTSTATSETAWFCPGGVAPGQGAGRAQGAGAAPGLQVPGHRPASVSRPSPSLWKAMAKVSSGEGWQNSNSQNNPRSSVIHSYQGSGY